MRTLTRTTAVLLTSILATGCTVGPNYKRPPTDLPESFRGQPMPQASGGTAPGSVADEQWSRVFQDDVLQELIRTALEHNDDVQIAAVRILEARAQLGITRADQF